MAVQRYDIRRADGAFETKYWSPKNLPVLSPAGEVLYIMHRVEDVTDLVQATELGEELRGKTRAMEREIIKRSHELATANQWLRDANAKLGELDAAKTAFFSNVSHEFRTPLTLMLGPLESALHSGMPLAGENLRLVHRSSVRLLRLVNSLLDFARLEAGRLQLRFEPTDLANLTAGLAGSFQSLVEAAGMSLRVNCPPLHQPVYVDRAHWEKVVFNLLSNAFKFTLRGEIAVLLREQSNAVELIVSDTGTGIPEQELCNIFQRFHRIESAQGRSFEGTGIGLALVKELVELHGGSIDVRSTMGEGSVFTVSIPLGYGHLPQEQVSATRPGNQLGGPEAATPFVLEAARWVVPSERESSPPQSMATESSERRERILVVDDNADMRNHIVSLLSPEWLVETATDGKAALAKVLAAPPDLVISDVTMPHLDGFALVRALRSNAATHDVPVLLLSARAGEEAVVEGLELGADDYLVKPFSGRELLSRVRSHLNIARSRSTALRAIETRVKRVVESGIVCITVSDDNGRIIEANDAFVQMVGCSREELLSGSAVWELLAPTRRRIAAGTHAWEGEYRHADGRRIPVLVAVEPLEGGESIAIALNLTEHKQLEEQYRQAQKMEAVGRLAGGIAHDFNNVLSVILSYADVISADLGTNEPIRADVEQIHTAAIRAADLTRQLLAFSRQQVLETKVMCITACLAGLEKMLHRLLGADVDLTLLLESEPWNVMADRSQIEQIIMNLVVNARDAMPQGGKLTIQTANVTLDEGYVGLHHGVEPGDYVLLTVSDTGIGMDAATQTRIFEPFFTTKQKGKGTGLGLATVFGIVKQSGGHIWVYSEPGKGTAFKLYFPKVSAEAEPSSEPPPAESSRGTETILLVEDDPQVRTLAGSILRRSGYVVLEAANGGEALLICEQHQARIDLLLTDVVLPLMSGRQIADRLRALRPDIEVLYMSGYTDDAVLQHGILDSGVAYLQKPLTPRLLTSKVREVLQRKTGD
jgi:PAS domain S-box-containing protein